MSVASIVAADRAFGGLRSWRETSDLAGIEQIFLSSVNLIVLKRPSRFITNVTDLVGVHRRFLRTVSCRSLSADAVSAALPPVVSTELCADIYALCDLFHTITDASQIGIRLEVTDRQSCPKFHTDKVSLRMMTTYYGAATQWLDNGSIHQAAAGDVLYAKGELWRGECGACVHRSPPPINSDCWRVLMTLDVV
jgi:hypothetical protein